MSKSISLEYDSSGDALTRVERIVAWVFCLGAVILSIGPLLFTMNLVQCLWSGRPPPIYGAGLPYTVFVPLWTPVLLWCVVRGVRCLSGRQAVASLLGCGLIAFGLVCVGGVLLRTGLFADDGMGSWRNHSVAERSASVLDAIAEPAPVMCLLLPWICLRPRDRATWRRRALLIATIAFGIASLGGTAIIVAGSDPISPSGLWKSLLRMEQVLLLPRRISRVAAWVTFACLVASLVRRERLWPLLALAAAVVYVASASWIAMPWRLRTDQGLMTLARQLDGNLTYPKRSACMLLTLVPAMWLCLHPRRLAFVQSR